MRINPLIAAILFPRVANAQSTQPSPPPPAPTTPTVLPPVTVTAQEDTDDERGARGVNAQVKIDPLPAGSTVTITGSKSLGLGCSESNADCGDRVFTGVNKKPVAPGKKSTVEFNVARQQQGDRETLVNRYTVYVRDANGKIISQQEVTVLPPADHSNDD
ncbi:MAG: hypothetical protein WC901_02925 [Candidatus Margulisiibacteriota bacterium]